MKSFAAFEYIRSEDQDIVERVLTIFANIFMDEESARNFIGSRYKEYKMILKQLRFFINENDLENEVV